MKITFVLTPMCGLGGIERVVSTLAKFFHDRGDEVTMIFLQNRFKYPCFGKVLELNINYPNNKFGKLLYDLHNSIKLRNILLNLQPDIIYNIYWLTPLISGSLRKKIVSAVHDDPWAVPLIYQFFLRYFFPLSRQVIAPSRRIVEFMKNQWKIGNVALVRNPLSIETSNDGENKPINCDLGDGVPYILAAGRLVANKNFSLLINAFHKSKASSVLRLMIVGEGELRKDLEDLIIKLGLRDKVSLPGFEENIFHFMKHCEFFVCPSLIEPFGMVIIEALANGAPVISTECTATRELIDGEANGLLVKNNDVDALANSIDKMYYDVQFRMQCKKNTRLSIKKYLIENVMDEYLRLFRMMIDGSKI